MVFCARDFSLTVRAFWCAEQLRWVEKNFEEMKKVDQCSDEMKTVEKNLSRRHVRRDGMRWDEVKWGEKSSHDLRWDEVWSMKCKCEVWSAGCEECSVKCEESVCLALHGTRVAHRSCSWATSVQQVRTKHAQAWMAHGACNFYRWERKNTYSITLRQLPPRLVRVLLVALLISYWLLSF